MKWKSIRDYLRRILDRGKSGAAGGLRAKNKWALYPYLSFLIPHMTNKRGYVISVQIFVCFNMESSELYSVLFGHYVIV